MILLGDFMALNMVATNYTKLKIGDIGFSLVVDKDDIPQIFDAAYRTFLTEDDCEVSLDLHCRPGPAPSRASVLFDASPGWRLLAFEDGYFLETRNYKGVFNSDFTQGTVHVVDRDQPAFNYPLDEILMVNLLSRGRGILLHACAVDYEGRGFLFVGGSGAGKSTLARLWQQEGATILNDDRAIIRRQNNEFFIYGTPWHGDVNACSACRTPLEKIFFVKHAEENHVQPLSVLDASTRMVVFSFAAHWDKNGMAFTLEFCAELSASIPCYELGFVPDETIIELVK
jgi:hypothetical protein